jgi:hypothetical protein
MAQWTASNRFSPPHADLFLPLCPAPFHLRFPCASHSSPWSNLYSPPLDDGTAPSPKRRELEVQMNEGFDVYRDLCVAFSPG